MKSWEVTSQLRNYISGLSTKRPSPEHVALSIEIQIKMYEALKDMVKELENVYMNCDGSLAYHKALEAINLVEMKPNA